MSLPRKRKKLSENQTPEENRQTGQTRRSSENLTPKVTARTKQMQKAFEIVDHIEHIHGNPEQSTPSHSVLPPAHRKSSDPEELRMRVSLGSLPTEKQASGAGSDGSSAPVIEVKFTIPSFLWKVPVLGGVARSLIRKFSKVQA